MSSAAPSSAERRKKESMFPEIGKKPSSGSLNGSLNGSRPTSSSSQRSKSGKSPSKQQISIDRPKREFSTVKSADLLAKKQIQDSAQEKVSQDALSQQLSDLCARLAKCSHYDTEEAKTIQENVSQSYWKYPELAGDNGMLLYNEGYIVASVKMLKSLNEMGIFKSDQVWFPTYYTYNAVWNYSNGDPGFSHALADAGVMSLLMANLGHQPYLDAMDSPNVTYVLKASLGILTNIARCHETRYLFKDYKIRETIDPFTKSEDEFFKTSSLMLVAFLVEEHYLVDMNKQTNVISCLCTRLGLALDDPEHKFHTIKACNIAVALVALAAYDEYKQKLTDAGAVEEFIKMLPSSNKMETKTALSGLWSLSFNKDAREKMHESTTLIEHMTMMKHSIDHKESKEKDDTEFKRLFNGTMYQMKSGHEHGLKSHHHAVKKEEDVASADDKEKPKSDEEGHVFISYSWSNQKIILQISDALKNAGYKVWIDVDQMNGDTLEAMALAVENAAVVLMCVSESYKESSNCRTEAEYTFSLKKPYVPCYMQKKYKADGWLGALVGSKIYVDFTGRDPFPKSMTSLRKEIGGIENGRKESASGNKSRSASNAGGDKKDGPVTWTKAQVQQWMVDKALAECAKAVAGFDGRLLSKLMEMRQEAPEFYYRSLDKKFGWSMVEILMFTDAIDKLQLS